MVAQNWAWVWDVIYAPFGGVSAIWDSTTKLDMRFPGQWFQLESGLAYNWHRHYDATLGRYVQPDPIGYGGGRSLYGYVSGNPLVYVDPYGLWTLGDFYDGFSYWGDAFGGATDFGRNYYNMRQAWTSGADKYFHCRANCEATQRGPGGQDAACTISDAREWWDQNIKGYPASDSESDQSANRYGRSMARKNPQGSCAEACAQFRPSALPPIY